MNLFELHEWLARWFGWGWILLANHLWQSTFFFLLIYLITLILRRGQARWRYLVWLAALVKFILPSALIVWLIKRAGVDLATLFATSKKSLIESISLSEYIRPIFQVIKPPIVIIVPSEGHGEFYCLITLIWLSGTFLILSLWLVRIFKFASLIKKIEPVRDGRVVDILLKAKKSLGISRTISLIISPHVNEPTCWRIYRPVIILPAGIDNQLNDDELEAILIHELIHYQRKDNLFGQIQMLLCAIFWFHPFSWLVSRKLLEEREISCDERVIKNIGSTIIYASCLVKVLRFCLRTQIAGFSYMGGSNLNRRIELISSISKKNPTPFWPGSWLAITAGILVLFSLIVFKPENSLSETIQTYKPAPELPTSINEFLDNNYIDWELLEWKSPPGEVKFEPTDESENILFNAKRELTAESINQQPVIYPNLIWGDFDGNDEEDYAIQFSYQRHNRMIAFLRKEGVFKGYILVDDAPDNSRLSLSFAGTNYYDQVTGNKGAYQHDTIMFYRPGYNISSFIFSNNSFYEISITHNTGLPLRPLFE